MKTMPMAPRARGGLLAHRPSPAAAQSGAASLIVVMVLFFLMSLVAAYTSRNLIFEQRTSVNQYRATQAYEAAEAGLEWALTLLNSGRIGPDCLEASATASDTSFRQRYLQINADTGVVTPQPPPPGVAGLWPSCVSNGAGGWACHCPADAAPTLPATSGSGVFPAFRVRFTKHGIATSGSGFRPGLVRIESNGCTKPDDACLNHPASSTVGLEGHANVAAIVALTSALPTPPGAALTLLNGPAAGSTLKVYNTEPDLGGITVQSGGAISPPPATWTLRSMPGTPAAASVVSNVASLTALPGEPDSPFAAVFGMRPATYRTQPAAVQVDCPAAGCSTLLVKEVNMNPGRVIWVNAPDGLTLETAGTVVGSAADPAMIVVDGPVNFAATGVRINGFVYSRSGNWQGAGEIRGGAYVEGSLAATAAATVVMDNTTLKALQRRSGSFVRAPGGWDDFRKRDP